ncbi:oligosaccharide flippase family protein, partial [Mycobacterium tuberculosis]|uniref:oligosaccharide flippase family protein n=1 Tax=Mycobacterium tuberculosis TaxID=1773 RepID=UPI0018796D86
VTVALILASLLLKEGIEHAAAGAAFGATAGGAAGLIYLCAVYFRHPGRRLSGRGRRGPLTAGRELVKLLRFSLPITLTVILMPLLQTLDTLLVPKRLQGIGYTIKQATAMLGVLGNSWAVIALPLIATGALAANLVPSIAALTRSAR